jgi:hypothetical protein
VSDANESGLCRIVATGELPVGGRPFRIESNAAECRRLARWLAVESLSGLRAEGVIEPQAGAFDVKLSGRIAAEVTQRCVVTLEPLQRRLDIPFERLYSAGLNDEWGMYGAGTEEIFLDLETGPVAEPLPDGGIDIGAIVAEELALDLDPFPRSPAVAAGIGDEAAADDDAPGTDGRQRSGADAGTRPFARLGERLSKR